MAAYRYPTIKPVVAPELTPNYSSANQGTLQALFPGAPGAPGGTYGADDGEQKLRTQGLESLLKGVEEGNLMTGRVDKDYGINEGTPELLRPPNYSAVPVGGRGLPASPWVPNPVSPGPGSANPNDIAEAPTGYGKVPTNTINPVPASSEGRNPEVSSKRMSGGQEVGELVPGLSPANRETL